MPTNMYKLYVKIKQEHASIFFQLINSYICRNQEEMKSFCSDSCTDMINGFSHTGKSLKEIKHVDNIDAENSRKQNIYHTVLKVKCKIHLVTIFH